MCWSDGRVGQDSGISTEFLPKLRCTLTSTWDQGCFISYSNNMFVIYSFGKALGKATQNLKILHTKVDTTNYNYIWILKTWYIYKTLQQEALHVVYLMNLHKHLSANYTTSSTDCFLFVT